MHAGRVISQIRHFLSGMNPMKFAILDRLKHYARHSEKLQAKYYPGKTQNTLVPVEPHVFMGCLVLQGVLKNVIQVSL
jgi:hypothetical protein